MHKCRKRNEGTRKQGIRIHGSVDMIAELGSFIAREQTAAAPALPPAADGKLTRGVAVNGSSATG